MNPVSPGDEEFFDRLRDIVLKNLECEDFGGKQLADYMGMSTSTLNRHIHRACDKNINQFIRETRLRQAWQLLHEQSGNVSEVAYKTGFGSPAYFNKCFHEYFGYTPGEVLKHEAGDFSILMGGVDKGKTAQIYTSSDHHKSVNRIKWLKRIVLTIAGLIMVFLLVQYFFPVIMKYPGNNDEVFWHTIPVNSIAVLPPSNLTGNPDLQYFASGVHDALVGELGRISELLVKSRTSTLPFTDGDMTIQQIATDIGVRYIVEGSVAGTDDSLQIRIQLIEVFPYERHIWSSFYSQDWSNVLFIYRDLCKQIADQIHIVLSSSERQYLSTARVIDPELYKLYIRGVFHLDKLTDEGFKQGVEYLNKAIAIDPSEPLPYLGMAIAYSNAGHASSEGEDAHLLAKHFALKALALDSSLAEAHAVLATYYLYQEWDWEKTEHALSRAIELNPNIALAHYTNGWFQLLLGNNEAAVNEMNHAIDISPLDPICTGYLGWLYLWLGMYDQAIEQAMATLEIDPNYIMAHYVLGSALADLGRYEEAIEAHIRGVDIYPGFLCGLGVAYARSGRTKEALEIAMQLEKKRNAWNAWGLSDLYAVLGDTDKAIEWVQVAYELRQDFIPWIYKNPYYKPLHAEPEFIDVARLVGPP
jgi:tetratricopeptide (TPR) repeat protein/AraC-like DNA-binding protein